jgi:hypothetical protein
MLACESAQRNQEIAAGRYHLSAMTLPSEPPVEPNLSETTPRPRPTFGASAIRPPEQPAVDLGPGRHRGGSVEVKRPRRLGRIILAVVLAAFTVLVVVLFVQAHSHDEEISTLQQHGVPVDVTIKGCDIQQAGTGGTPSNYFICRGSFVLNGKTYTKVILSDQHVQYEGAHLAATVNPNNTNAIYPTSVVRQGTSAWYSGTPLILLVILLVTVGLVAWWGFRTRGTPPAVEVIDDAEDNETTSPLIDRSHEPPARGPNEIMDQLDRLSALRHDGVLTEAEFRTLKSRLLQ